MQMQLLDEDINCPDAYCLVSFANTVRSTAASMACKVRSTICSSFTSMQQQGRTIKARFRQGHRPFLQPELLKQDMLLPCRCNGCPFQHLQTSYIDYEQCIMIKHERLSPALQTLLLSCRDLFTLCTNTAFIHCVYTPNSLQQARHRPRLFETWP